LNNFQKVFTVSLALEHEKVSFWHLPSNMEQTDVRAQPFLPSNSSATTRLTFIPTTSFQSTFKIAPVELADVGVEIDQALVCISEYNQ